MDELEARNELEWRLAMVGAVRQHAKDHYNEGWDVIVEAYTDDEIVGIILGAEYAVGEESCIEAVAKVVELYKEKKVERPCIKCGREVRLTPEELDCDDQPRCTDENECRAHQELVAGV